MFFRILKKDLKEKIGLNIVLFIFMVVASMFVVASALQLYANFKGYDRSYKVCNSSDVFLVNNQSVDARTEQIAAIDTWLADREDVKNVEFYETIRYNSKTLDFKDFDERNSAQFKNQIYYLITQPTDQNLVLDMNEETFQVENGCVAIPRALQILTGAKVGETLRITTQMGYIYEFKISHIFKDPAVMNFCRLIVSDSDYEVLYNESPLKYDFYAIQQGECSNLSTQLKLMRDFEQDENIPVNISYAVGKCEINNDILMGKVVMIFMSLISVFLILLILMTIRFTMISAIKREEREIGMMKAIGVDSVYFKWLFAAKYIAFSVMGGVFGGVLGIPISNTMFNKFSYHMLSSSMTVTIAIAVIAAFFSTFLIIMFTFFAMRRMDKVKVMDALHGENRGERFKKLPGFFLYRRKNMKVPLFLTFTDIIGRIKRYVFLIAAYVFGITIMLITIQLKDSVVSEDYYIKYGAIAKLDFEVKLKEELRKEYKAKSGSGQGVNRLINEDFAKNNIPAKIEAYNAHRGTLIFNGQESHPLMYWGISDTAEVTYRKGSVAPRLHNEIALDYYTACNEGIKLGDTVSMKYDKLTEDGLTSKMVTEDFIVTAFFDYTASATIMGNEFEGAVVEFGTRFKAEIDAPESEKTYYIQKMRELYGEECVQDQDELIKNMAGGWNTILTMLRDIMCVTVVVLLVLITLLYQNIFMEEEVSSVALLKSIGFDNKNIKKWQYSRVIILVVMSFVIAVLFTATVGNLFMHMVFELLVNMSGFSFRVIPVTNYILLPLVLVFTVTMVLVVVLKPIEKIQIWRIRNE